MAPLSEKPPCPPPPPPPQVARSAGAASSDRASATRRCVLRGRLRDGRIGLSSNLDRRRGSTSLPRWPSSGARGEYPRADGEFHHGRTPRRAPVLVCAQQSSSQVVEGGLLRLVCLGLVAGGRAVAGSI